MGRNMAGQWWMGRNVYTGGGWVEIWLHGWWMGRNMSIRVVDG